MSIKPTSNTRREDENRDLGFGAVVAGESRQRLLNRDGSFNVTREGLGLWASLSLYHSLLTMRWWKFLTVVTLSYLLTNIAFATGYMMCGVDALENSVNANLGNGFARAFFFSVETFATIGYGNIAPVGLAPNILMTLESLFGLLGFALATGLLFARFSRPTAQIIFSKTAIMAPYRDVTAFEFRITNARRNQIIELEAKVLFARFEDEGGRNVRRFYPLALERERVTFFPLSWTIVHPIDEASPIYGLTRADMLGSNAEFLILLTGIDETFSQTVHTRSSYRADEVVWNAKFRDVFNRRADAETLTIDVRRLHLIEPVGSPDHAGD
jgi:inward rectifier potassium channel